MQRFVKDIFTILVCVTVSMAFVSYRFLLRSLLLPVLRQILGSSLVPWGRRGVRPQDEGASTISLTEFVERQARESTPRNWAWRLLRFLLPDCYWVLTFTSTLHDLDISEVAQRIASDPRVVAAQGPSDTDARTAFVATELGLMTAATPRFVRVALDKFMVWMVLETLRLVYPHGVHICKSDLQALQEWQRETGGLAPPNAQALAYCPTHKSIADYLIFWFLCRAVGLPQPKVIVEMKHLRGLSGLGWLLRAMGALCPDQHRLLNDHLYRAIFTSYVSELLASGQCLQCFVEGGRERMGKATRARGFYLPAFIAYVTNNRHGDHTDVHTIACAITYDRTIENDTFVGELVHAHSSTARPGSIVGVLAMVSRVVARVTRRQLYLGSVAIGMGYPRSVRAFVDAHGRHTTLGFCGLADNALPTRSRTGSESQFLEFGQDETSTERLLRETQSALARMDSAGSDDPQLSLCLSEMLTSSSDDDAPEAPSLVHRTRTLLSTALGNMVLHEANTVMMCRQAWLVSVILLTQYKRGLARADIADSVAWLRGEIERRGGRVAGDISSLHQSIRKVMDRVLMTVAPEEPSHVPSEDAPVQEAAWQAVRSISALGANADEQLVKRHKDSILFGLYGPRERMALTMYRNGITHVFCEEAIVACGLYALERQKKEFPARVNVARLRRYTQFLAQMLHHEFVYRPHTEQEDSFRDTLDVLVERQVLGFDAGDNEAWVDASFDEIDNLHESGAVHTSRGTNMFLFLCSLVWPFVDSYLLVVLGLFALHPKHPRRRDVMTVDELISHVRQLGEVLFFQGQLDLYEALSMPTLRNAVQLFVEWGVVHVEGTHSSRTDFREWFSETDEIVLALAPEYYDDVEALESLYRQIAVFKKRSRTYSSRRYTALVRNDIDDALANALSH